MASTQKTVRNVPAEIEKKMQAWRHGFAPLPVEYIAFMQNQAMAAIQPFCDERGWKLRGVWMAEDGWGDGMLFLHAAVEVSRNKLKLIKFSDCQCWYQQADSGAGWLLI